MDRLLSHAITRLRVVATLVIVAYHAVCPYGGWEAFTGTIGGGCPKTRWNSKQAN